MRIELRSRIEYHVRHNDEHDNRVMVFYCRDEAKEFIKRTFRRQKDIEIEEVTIQFVVGVDD